MCSPYPSTSAGARDGLAGQPGMLEGGPADVVGCLGQVRPPVTRSRGCRKPGVRVVGHQLDQLVAAFYVAVEGHRARLQLLCHSPHRDGVQPFAVRDLDARTGDPRVRQRYARAPCRLLHAFPEFHRRTRYTVAYAECMRTLYSKSTSYPNSRARQMRVAALPACAPTGNCYETMLAIRRHGCPGAKVIRTEVGSHEPRHGHHQCADL